MTTGSLLYLLLALAMFVVFAAVLAYQSWQDGRATAAKTTAMGERSDAVHLVSA